MAPKSSFGSHAMRVTDTHVFFWGSILSNWDQSHHFSGARGLEILLPRLRVLCIHPPSEKQASTQLITRHTFNCGEQFIMACKAWLFDEDPKASMLKAILESKKPMVQKSLGRKVPGFNDTVWLPASVEIVVASQIARAEVDQRLAKLYESSGEKQFVEGSPRDKIWGVGIHWKERAIEDERNWRGENRLGKCHGLAREALRRQKEEKLAEVTDMQNGTETPGEDAINAPVRSRRKHRRSESTESRENIEDRKILKKLKGDFEDSLITVAGTGS